MRNTSLGQVIWIILPAVWLCQTTAMAQLTSVFGNPLTNNIAAQSNNFESELSRLQSRFGAPYMGTTLAHTMGGRPPYNPSGPPLETLGPFHFYPHLLYEASYGDALPAQRGSNSTTFINEVAPGMLMRIGRIWTLDYTPSLYFYSNPIFHDKTDQDAILSGITTNGDWTLSLSQSYVEITQPLEETGTQTEQTAYATAFNSTWQMGAKASLEFGLNQNFRYLDSTELNSLHEWRTTDWFSYQFMPQLGAGLGLAGGYDELSYSSDMYFEQLLGRVVFRAGTKLALTLMGGLEERHFVDSSAAPELNPIFQALGLYQLREGTLLSVTASRLVVPSLYTNDVNIITTVTAGIRQHIVGNLQLEIEGNYTLEPFTSIQPVPVANSIGFRETAPLTVVRTDTRESLDVRLSTVFRTRLTASLFCLFINNSSVSSSTLVSSQTGPTYFGIQGGIELEYRY
jgi:hypothetical protein